MSSIAKDLCHLGLCESFFFTDHGWISGLLSRKKDHNGRGVVVAEHEEKQAAGAYDDDDAVTESVEVVELREKLEKLTVELSELRSVVCKYCNNPKTSSYFK